MKKKYKVIDLFCGCGGLSYGLKEAGFDLALAVEKSDMAAETFYHNFIKKIENQGDWERFVSPETSIQEQAKHKLIVRDIKDVLECDELIEKLKEEEIDLIAGGPPCQGFSLAGRRNPNDARNQLPWHFLSLVEKIKPKAVIMENVAGIQSKFRKHEKDSPFGQLKSALMQLGYVVQPVLLNAMHYGVPQYRPRVMLIGIKADIAEKLNLNIDDKIWKSEFAVNNPGYIYPSIAPEITHQNGKVRTVKEAFKQINTKTAKNHILRKHNETIIARFRLYQYLQENKIPLIVFNFVAKNDMTRKENKKELKGLLSNAIFPAKSPDGKVIAKNLDELAELIIKLPTKKHSQRPLVDDCPSPTVVTLPDDYIHPTEPRTLTVREMATLQSFPQEFEFRAKETTGGTKRRTEVPQYSQVGNAVPPLLAKAVGKKILEILHAAENIDTEGTDLSLYSEIGNAANALLLEATGNHNVNI